MKYFYLKIAFLFSLISVYRLHAQESLLSTYDTYNHYLYLQGDVIRPNSLHYKSYSNNTVQKTTETSLPWENTRPSPKPLWEKNGMSLGITDFSSKLDYVSEQPYSQNDGNQWVGKGTNWNLSGGAYFNTEHFQFTFFPSIWYAQNLSFDIVSPDLSQANSNGYYNGKMDYPQRMGDSSLWQFDWGNTDLRYNYNSFTVGISHEEVWLGPSMHNALIMSNNAGGLPHVDIGMNRQTVPYVGDLEFRYTSGFAHESVAYNDNPDDDWRQYNLMNFAVQPFFLPALTLGFNWAAMTKAGEITLANAFTQPATLIDTILGTELHTQNDPAAGEVNEDTQLASMTFDIHIPSSGFQVYGELAWEDFGFLNPEKVDSTFFYTLGTSYAFNFIDLANSLSSVWPNLSEEKNNIFSSERGFLLNFEFSDLNARYLNPEYGAYNPYTHYKVLHGYTQEGQTIGATIGTGSIASTFNINYYDRWGMVYYQFQNLWVDDSYTEKEGLSYHERYTRFSNTIGTTYFLTPHFDLGLEATIIEERNYNYETDSDFIDYVLTLDLTYRL